MLFVATAHERIPTFYELEVRDNGTTIAIKIPTPIWEKVLELLLHKDLTAEKEESFKIAPFIEPGDLPWGFGPMLVFEKKESESPGTTIICELPRLFHEENTKEAEALLWKQSFGLVASLDFIFEYLEMIGEMEESSMETDQLLGVRTSIWPRENGHLRTTISAGLSIAASKWVESQIPSTQESTHHDAMTEHMRYAFSRLCGTKDTISLRDVHANIVSRHLIYFSTVGNATSLCSDPDNLDDSTGLELSCHNVDNPLQQLVLLVGLASLHTLARKDGY